MINLMTMKTFRLIGLVLLAIMLCVNFASCSNDDKVGDIDSGIEGTWYLLASQGYGIYDNGQKEEWDEKYPDLKENKMVIVKLSENNYLIKIYIDYDSNIYSWEDDPISFIAKRDGNDIIPIELLYDYWDSFKIVSISQNTLVIECFEKEDINMGKEDSYSKNTYSKE